MITGTVSAAQTMVFTFYNQYSQTLSYNLNDGGSGYSAPATIGGPQFGSAYNPTLTTSALAYWFDAGGTLTFTNPLTGSGSAERWVEDSASVPLTSSNTEVVQYYHQYQQFLSYTVTYGGSGYLAPTTTGLQLGSVYAPTITTSSAGYWFDASGNLAFTNPLGGSNSTHSWYTTTETVSATVQGTSSINYYNQYHLEVTGGHFISYSTPSPTSDNWYYPGSSTTVSSDWVWSAISGESRMAIITYQIDGGNQSQTRAESGTLTTAQVVFDTSHAVTFASTVQYYLAVSGGNGVIYGTPSPTLDNWYDSGTSTAVSSDGVFGRSLGTGQRIASWDIDGGANITVATTGNVTTSSITMSSYHTVTFDSATQYLVTFASNPTQGGGPFASTVPPINGDTGWYDAGSAASILANAEAYWSLTSWSASSGSIAFESTTSESTTATIGDTGVITASFAVTTPLSAGEIAPTSPAIDRGQSVILTANPEGGTHSYSYQWYTGSACVSNNAIPEKTLSQYPTRTLRSNSMFSVRVTDNGAGVPAPSSCASVNVAVNLPLSLTQFFVTWEQWAPTRANVTLTAVPSYGTPPYSYQWHTGSTCATDRAISGQNKSTYANDNVTPTFIISYSVNVSDSSAGVPSSSICQSSFTVTYAPILILSPSSMDAGQSVTVNATVSWPEGTPPYSVTLYSGTSRTCSADTTVVSSKTGLVGNSTIFSLTAPGSTTYYCAKVADSATPPASSSTSAARFRVISPATALTLSCNRVSLVVGSTFTCRAKVQGSGSAPTGNVTWLSSGPGMFSSTTCSLSPKGFAGTCSVKLVPTAAGSPVVLTASYGGDPKHDSSFGRKSLTVTMKTTKTTVSCAPKGPVASSQTIICRATVTGYLPTGTVIWSQSGKGSTTFTPASCTLTGGSCSVNATGTTSGRVTLKGTYGGDSNNKGSSGKVGLTVTKASTTTTLSCAQTFIHRGDAITCTATVSGEYPSQTGTVAWSRVSGNGGVSFSSRTCTLSSGSCSVTVTATVAGSVVIKATYRGDLNNFKSVGTLILAIT